MSSLVVVCHSSASPTLAERTQLNRGKNLELTAQQRKGLAPRWDKADFFFRRIKQLQKVCFAALDQLLDVAIDETRNLFCAL